jgi:hypothetical protein
MKKSFFKFWIFLSLGLTVATLNSCDKNDNNENDNNENYKDWTNQTEELRIHNKNKISVTEGIIGTLVKTEGNCMPSIIDDIKTSTCKQFPVKREIFIYEYTTSKDVKQVDYSSFYEEVNTELVATTTCDDEGFFELTLKPGKYSVFVKEGEYLYANGFDGEGGISSVTVDSDSVSERFLDMNYAASY